MYARGKCRYFRVGANCSQKYLNDDRDLLIWEYGVERYI